jgi:predicted Zn-dependent protease
MWVVGNRSTPHQPASLRPVLDRATEAKAAVNRVGQELVKVSLQEEIALGARLEEQERQRGLPEGAGPAFGRQQAWLEDVVRFLTAREGGLRRPEMPYRVQLLDLPEANAFALPGGRIFITTALLDLADSEAEVAAILAHEIAHVDLRHCIERYQAELRARKLGGAPLEAMASLGTRVMLQGYRDEQESEADRWGAWILARVGYHPQAAQRMLAKLDGRPAQPRAGTLSQEASQALSDGLEDYFASHPRGDQRIANLELALRESGIDPEDLTFYIGVRNLKTWTSRARQEFPEEYVQKRIHP